jgi:EmrB/QacA subfamily drug resistance transporter
MTSKTTRPHAKAPPQEPGGARSTGPLLLVVLLSLGLVVAAVPALNVALPNVAERTGATQSQLQWIVDAYAVVFAGLLLSAGALGDRYGRKPILAAGLVIFSAGSAAACFATAAGPLIAMRALMGVGAALVMPTTLSILTTSLPGHKRDRAVGAWVGVAGAGAILGLLSSGVLLEVFNWPSIFVLNAVIGSLLVIAALLFVPNSRHATPPRVDYLGAALSTLGLTCVVFGVIEGPNYGWAAPLTLSAFGAGALALALWLAWSLRTREPLLDPRLFRLRDFAGGTVSLTVQFFAFFGVVFVIMQYLQLVRGYSPLQAALALVPMGVILAALSRRAGQLVRHRGRRFVSTAGLVLMAIGLVVLSQLDTGSTYWLVLAGLLPLGAGMALATVPATTGILASLPQSKQGVASAVNDAARELGGTLGIAVLGSILASAFHGGVVAAAPAQLRETAGESLPAALGVAGRLGAGGQALADAARQAFVTGVSHAFLTAGALLGLTALVLALRASKTTVPVELPPAQPVHVR